MKNYELLAILPGTLSEDEVEPLVKKIQDTIEQNSANDVKIKDMGKNRLAYPVKHIRYGYFQLFTFEAEADSVNTIQAKLKLIPELLRSLVTIYDPKKRKENKISYVTDQSGMTTIKRERFVKRPEARNQPLTQVQAEEKQEESKEEKHTIDSLPEEEVSEEKENRPVAAVSAARDKKIDLEDIDAQLDKILEGDIGGV